MISFILKLIKRKRLFKFANNGWSSAIADGSAEKLGNYKDEQPLFSHTKR